MFYMVDNTTGINDPAAISQHFIYSVSYTWSQL